MWDGSMRSATVHGDDQQTPHERFLAVADGDGALGSAGALVRGLLWRLVDDDELRDASGIDQQLIAGLQPEHD